MWCVCKHACLVVCPSSLLPYPCAGGARFQSTAQVECLLLEHGERVVDRLGAEIDRVEIKTKMGVGQEVG